MANVRINDCFPAGSDGKRGPLPKQKMMMDLTKDPLGPKYIAYYGGVGSGKSLILCVNMMMQGILHGGEYVIARQFMPELRRTTLKTFLEVLPKELLVEFRVADAEVHIKSVHGTAVYYFVGLDDPDKLRSLNLSGFGIDEASQVSFEAFELLQGRLRNKKGLRKGLIVGNPAGHDWVYQTFVKQDKFSDPAVKKQYRIIVAPSTENTHLPSDYVKSMLGSWSPERIQREVMGSFDAFEGQVYNEFRRDVHVVKPFAIPDNWVRGVGADHGYRNPACWLWCAVDGDGNIYIYREFYEREWDIDEICNGKKDPKSGRRIPNNPGVISLNNKDKLEGIWIDPATKAHRGSVDSSGSTIKSEFDQYTEFLPLGWDLYPANNGVQVGIDRVKQFLKIDAKTNKPRLFIFDTCVNVINEMVTYRYAALAPNASTKSNEKEVPVKKNDHAMDALKYFILSRPDPFQEETDWYKEKNIARNSITGSIHAELESIRNNRNQDPSDIL